MANEYSINAKITADSTDFQEAVKKASKSLDGMKDSFNRATQNIKKSIADWGLDIDKFYNKGSKIFKDFGIDIDKFAAHFGTTGKVVAAITTASIALTKFGQSMNEARAEIAKGTGAVGEDLIKLQDTLHKAMIEGIGRDAKEVGGMMADLNTRFGATEKELVDMTVQFDKFSAVMGVDARQAINDTADVMAKWGIEAKDLNPLLDQLTTASQMSGASINELTSGLTQGQSVFSQFGMSATDSIAILSSLAKNGIETNSAITALKYSLNVFSKAGVDAKTGLNKTIEAITNAKTETEALSVACEVFGARNGVEMVKVLKSGSMSADEFKTALMNAGGALSSVDSASRTSVDAIADLKATLAGTFSGFGEGFDNLFRDLTDSVRELVEFVAPVIEPIGNIFRDVFSAIGQMLKVLVENFILFEEKFDGVFANVKKIIQTAYETIHKVLGNILEAFKTAFSLIFAILDGKWDLAWENAKKLALLFVKSLSDILSGIVKLFSKMINGIIEKLNSAIDLYHKLPKFAQIFDIDKIGKISENVDLSSAWGITGKLEEVQRKIDELSRKAVEEITGDLGEVSEAVSDTGEIVKTQAMEVAQLSIEWSNKLLQQEITMLEKRRDNAVAVAKSAKKSEEEIYAIKASYTEKINDLQIKQLNVQREAEIQKVKASKESLENQEKVIAQINTYYNNQIDLIKETIVFIEKTDEVTKKSLNAWDTWIQGFEDKANDWTTMTTEMAQAGTQAMGDMFETIGESLADDSVAFEDYTAVAVEAISKILKALGAQLAAEAAVAAAHYDYGTAAAAAAGAAAALVAAGTLKSVANNMKKTSEATKEASMSLKEFKERLENIWSGKSTSISVVASMRETDVIIKNSTDALKTAQAEYEKAVKQNNEKIKELKKSINDRTKAEVAAAVLVPIFGAVAAAQTQKSIDKDKKKINELSYEIFKAKQKVLEAETKLRMANAQYLQGIRDTNESLEAQIAENRSVVSDYKTLYSSLNGYNKEMSRSKEIVTELAKVVKNELLVNTTSLLNEVYSSFGSLGKDIGETLMNSIVDGASKSDFMDNMKKMIKQKILQLTIYTESFTKQIAQVGEKLVKSLMNDNKGLESVTKELSTLYDETAKKADKVNDLLNKAFNGYIDETADEVADKVDEVADKVDEFAEKLENLRSVVDNLKESLKALRSQTTVSFQNLVSNYASVSKELESLISAQQAVVDSLNKQHTDKYSVYKKNGIIYIPQDKTAEYRSELNQIKAAENELAALRKESSYLNVRLLRETQENLKKENSTLSEQISLYKSLYTLINVSDLSYKEIFTQSQINAIRNQLLNVQAELMNTATQIGSNIVSSIAKGATKADFMSSIKDYMKNQIVSLVVYSSGFESTLTELGRKMTKAISSGATNFTDLEKELSSLYDTVEKKVKTAYASLDKVFPDVNKNLKETSSSANTATASLSKLGEKIKSLKETLSDLGGDLADKLANGLKSGLSKNDMLATMKDYIKDMIIQTVVYTDSMKSQIESVGKKIAQAINSGNSTNVLGAKETIGSLYDTLTTKSKTALKWVEQLFPEMSKTVEKETINVEKSLTRLESAVQSFKETIADLGGDIAGNLVDGLTNGLSQSDFLTNMKNWIKKMLVQSVVYTEQMKSQIEAIGKTISNAISGGFTETSMHEIRRDLSFIFEQASSKMSGIDKVLGGVFDGYAAGTENAKQGLHIVGEAGPELVRFRGGERVYNNHDTMSMLSGGNKTNNFNVTFNNLQDTSAYAMMSQLKRYNKEMAINGVI